jgi:hypothetical protein
MTPDALATALGELVERCLDQEPHPVCTVCRWNAATATPIYLVHDQGDGVRRGAVLPICCPCMCLPDIRERMEQVIRKYRRQGRAAWN